MRNIHTLEGHRPYPFAEGSLNAAIGDRARKRFADKDMPSLTFTAPQKAFDVRLPREGQEAQHVAA